MYILVTKELDALSAEKLRNAKRILATVAAPENFQFLPEEFQLTTEITANYKDVNKLIINEKLQPFAIFPKYTIHNNYFKETVYENSNLDTEKMFNAIVFKVILRLQNEGKNHISGKALELIIKPSENCTTESFNFSRKKASENNVISDLINYFHNRQTLYFNISEILRANQKKLITCINNEEFVKDLLALFSVKAWDLNPAFDISGVLTHKELVIFEAEKVIAEKKAQTTLLSTLEGNTSSALYSFGLRRAEVALIKDTNLLTMRLDTGIEKTDFFNLGLETLTSNNLKQFLEGEKLKSFSGAYLNQWLSRYLALANFAFKVFETVQAKVILNHI